MKKKFVKVLACYLALAMIIGIVPAFTPVALAADTWNGTDTAAAYAGGSGTSANPYLIATGAQLAYLASNVNGGTSYGGTYFKLIDDINLDSKSWTSIGKDNGHAFSGFFEGNGKTISNLASSNSTFGAVFSGVFGNVTGTVQNLNVGGSVSAHTTSFNSYAGGVVAYLNGGAVRNCSSSCTVVASGTPGYFVSLYSMAGGIVGSSSGTVQNCFSTGSVQLPAHIMLIMQAALREKPPEGRITAIGRTVQLRAALAMDRGRT